MNSGVKIITTSDGSHSLLNPVLDETYHSVHGALQESKHVFIKNGFNFFCERSSVSPVNIFEMGFGTGLNAWLTAQRALLLSREVHYASVETFPLPEAVWRQLNYAHTSEEKSLFAKIHNAKWSQDVPVIPGFMLKKIEATLQQMPPESAMFDLVYFDAFAPSKQPELWEFGLLKKIVDAMKAGAVFVTYCAKGQVKRDLKNLGLLVETLDGPPGKKEMIRGLKS